MRIHTDADGVSSYINALAKSISIDPGSLEAWLCLHISFSYPPSLDAQASMIDNLWTAHHRMDCDVFCCEDCDIFLVSRSLPASILYQLADEIVGCAGDAIAEVHGYDLFQNWHQVRQLLLEKTAGHANAPAFSFSKSSQPEHYFGDTKALSGVFSEATLIRKARSPLHVLVVEDDPMTRRLVINALKDKYVVVGVATAYDAVANYLLHAPDIVFLDIGLPDVSGFKVLRQIIDNDPDAYVVMFSGDSDLDNVLGALNAGASGFIAKPVSKQKLNQYMTSGAQWHHKNAEA